MHKGLSFTARHQCICRRVTCREYYHEVLPNDWCPPVPCCQHYSSCSSSVHGESLPPPWNDAQWYPETLMTVGHWDGRHHLYRRHMIKIPPTFIFWNKFSHSHQGRSQFFRISGPPSPNCVRYYVGCTGSKFGLLANFASKMSPGTSDSSAMQADEAGTWILSLSKPSQCACSRAPA